MLLNCPLLLELYSAWYTSHDSALYTLQVMNTVSVIMLSAYFESLLSNDTLLKLRKIRQNKKCQLYTLILMIL